MPDQDFLKKIAAQLRKPVGEFGYEVAKKMNESNKAMNLATIAELKIKDGDRILEVGMGNGFFVKDILSMAKEIHYIGCDYSLDMVHLASALNSKFISSGQAFFHLSEAHYLPVDNTSIDHILTVNTIYFWEDIPSTLSEFKRVLKKLGTLAIAIRPKNCLKQYPSTRYNFTYYSREQIKNILVENGFSVIQVIEKKEPEVNIMEKKVIPEYTIVIAVVLDSF